MPNERLYEPNILIVGAGIAGATIAAGLRNRGYSVVHIEASNSLLDTARGDHLGPRVVEVLDDWKILDAFFQAGAKKRLGARWFDFQGNLIHQSSVDDLPIPYPYFIVLNHELIASVSLSLAIKDLDYDYTFFRPVLAKNILTSKESYGGVSEVNFINNKHELIRIRPKLTIACDGRSSKIRQACNFDISKSYNYKKLFVVLFGPRSEQQDSRNEIINYLSPDGGVSRIPRMMGQWKMGLSIEKEEISLWKNSTLDNRKALITKRAPVLDDCETEVAGFYPVIRRETNNWVKGTTVLIGDSCHTIHPARGQGMNFGIRCAARLFEFLPRPNKMSNAKYVASCLMHYEESEKPLVDKQLEDNHQYGLYSDSSNLDRFNKEIPHLEFLSKNKEANYHYRMTMAGYADRVV